MCPLLPQFIVIRHCPGRSSSLLFYTALISSKFTSPYGTVTCWIKNVGVMGERAWNEWLIRGRTWPQICAADAWHNITEDERVWKGAEILMHVHLYAHIPGILPRLRASSEQWLKQGSSVPLDRANGEGIPVAECQSRALQGLQNKRQTPNLLTFILLLVGIARWRQCQRVCLSKVLQWKTQYTHNEIQCNAHANRIFGHSTSTGRDYSYHYTFSRVTSEGAKTNQI